MELSAIFLDVPHGGEEAAARRERHRCGSSDRQLYPGAWGAASILPGK